MTNDYIDNANIMFNVIITLMFSWKMSWFSFHFIYLSAIGVILHMAMPNIFEFSMRTFALFNKTIFYT